MKKFIALTALVSMMTLSGAAFAEEAPAEGGLNLSPGTLFAGGQIGFMWNQLSPDEGDSITSTTLEFAPVVGYFVTPEIAVVGSILYRSTSVEDDDSSEFGLFAGARYHIPVGKMVAYVGGDLGFSSSSNGADISQYGLRVSGGILYPFNQYVALDAGVRISYMMGTWEAGEFEYDFSSLSFGLGYLGFVGYFNL